MAFVSNTGNMVDYYNSQPFQGVKSAGTNPMLMTFYFSSQPYQFMISSSSGQNFFFMFN